MTIVAMNNWGFRDSNATKSFPSLVFLLQEGRLDYFACLSAFREKGLLNYLGFLEDLYGLFSAQKSERQEDSSHVPSLPQDQTLNL